MHPSKERTYKELYQLFFRTCANQPHHVRLSSDSPPVAIDRIEAQLELIVPESYKLFTRAEGMIVPYGWVLYGLSPNEPDAISVNAELRLTDRQPSDCFVFGKTGDEDFMAFPSLPNSPPDDWPVVWCDVDQIGECRNLNPYAKGFGQLLLGEVERMGREGLKEFGSLVEEANALRAKLIK